MNTIKTKKITPSYSKNSKNQSFWKFILSHHYAYDFDKCYKIGKNTYLCARCIGIYPVLIFLYILQYYIKLDIPSIADKIIILSAPLPAIIDWAGRKFLIWKGRNYSQTFTGIFLGIALARAIYLFHNGKELMFLMILFLGYFTIYGIVVVFSSIWRIKKIEKEFISGPKK